MKPQIDASVFLVDGKATSKHDEMLFYFEPSSKTFDKFLHDYCPSIFTTTHPEWINYSQFVKIKVEQWRPESSIIINDRYIGSVDLLIEIDSFIDEYVIKRHGMYGDHDEKYSRTSKILIEFKPDLISVSEAIRQITVYNAYIHPDFSFIVTYSDISRFQNICKYSGISLIQLPPPKGKVKDLSQYGGK